MKMNKYLFSVLLFVSGLFMACEQEASNSLPADIIDYPQIEYDWNWLKTVNLSTGDSALTENTDDIVFTYTENGVHYITEGGKQGQSYNYYVTSETRSFNGNTCNKIYFYISGNEVYNSFFYLPNQSTLIIYDGDDYAYKGTFQQ